MDHDGANEECVETGTTSPDCCPRDLYRLSADQWTTRRAKDYWIEEMSRATEAHTRRRATIEQKHRVDTDCAIVQYERDRTNIQRRCQLEDDLDEREHRIVAQLNKDLDARYQRLKKYKQEQTPETGAS